MLTEKFLKDNLITAYFIDNERQNIEMLVRSDKKNSVFTEILPFDEKNEQYKNLIKIINLDQLHELTYQKKKEEKKEFETMAIGIAKKSGLVFDYEKIDTKFFPYMVKSIFEDQNNTDHLFAIKLALFELTYIRDSENNEARKRLRVAQNKLEVIQAALDCVKGMTMGKKKK